MGMFFGRFDLACRVSEKGNNTTTAATVGAGVMDKVVVKGFYGRGSGSIKKDG